MNTQFQRTYWELNRNPEDDELYVVIGGKQLQDRASVKDIVVYEEGGVKDPDKVLVCIVMDS